MKSTSWKASVLFAATAVLLVSPPGHGASNRSDQTRVVKMTIHPAAEPTPALKYALLPALLDQQPGNAAPMYKTLIDQWEKDPDHSKLSRQVADWRGVPVDQLPLDEVRQVLAAYPLEQLHSAARLEQCDWRLPIRTEGIQLQLPPLSALRGFARALALDARLQLAAGDYDKCLDSLQTGFALARHTGATPTLINALVEIAIGDLLLDVVAEWMGTEGSPNLYWALAFLPRPFADLSRPLEWERSLVYIHVPSLREAADTALTPDKREKVEQKLTEELAEMMRLATGEDGAAAPLLTTAIALKYYTPAKPYLIAKGYTPEQTEAMGVVQATALYLIGDYAYWSGRQQKWFALPYWQAHRGIQRTQAAFEEDRRTGKVGPLPLMLLPSLGKAYFIAVRLDRKVAALRCIEAVRMHAATANGQWPAALEGLPAPAPINPVTGLPFGFDVDGNRAVLTSDAMEGMRPSNSTRYEIILAD